MRVLKGLGAALQDGHQVDDRIVLADERAQRGFVMDAGLHHLQHGQHHDAGRIAPAPRGHRHLQQTTRQFFTHMAAHKARTAEHKHFLNHGLILPNLERLRYMMGHCRRSQGAGQIDSLPLWGKVGRGHRVAQIFPHACPSPQPSPQRGKGARHGLPELLPPL